jgi:hypothetical protein
MAHVEAVADVPVDPATLWREIGSFQRVGEWHPMLASVHGDGEEPGAVRHAIGVNGSEQIERLSEVDPGQWFYRYVMESSAMPVRDYEAELRVQARGDGTSTVRWTSEFEVTSGDEQETAGTVRAFLEAGVHSLTERHGR